MKKKTMTVLLCMAVLMLIFAACQNSQTDVEAIPLMPEIEYTSYGDNKCPQLNVTDLGYAIDTINSEIKAQFQWLSVVAGDDGAVQNLTTTAGQFISILLKAENAVGYGTDGKVWGICYDYVSDVIVPCGVYLDRMGYSYADIYDEIWKQLSQKGFYEYIDIPCYYFNSNSNPVFVVVAVEHDLGADSCEKVYCYDLDSNTFIECPWND